MKKIFNINAVLFDMDGILVDSEPLWEQSERESMAYYGVDYDEFFRQYDLTTTGVRIDQVVEIYCSLIPQFNISPPELTNRIINTVIDKIKSAKPILPGVKQALTLCHDLGLKVGLASSSPMRVIETVTNCLNIADQFEVLVSAEKLAYGKPHPEVYLVAAQKLGVKPLNCVTIEDSLAGMIATRAASMGSIVIPAQKDRQKPQWSLADYQLSSLCELNEIHLR